MAADYCLIILNCPIPQDISTKILITTDGGLNHLAEKTTRPPDYLIGDMDSVDPALLDKLRGNGKTQIIKISEQDTTDFEKALNFVSSELDVKQIIALNAFGGRIDHSLANLNLLIKYPQLQITLMNESCSAKIIREVPRECFGKSCAILPLFGTVRITTTGFKYEIDSDLAFGSLISVSNQVTALDATVTNHTSTPFIWSVNG